jgi:hypothetical protein
METKELKIQIPEGYCIDENKSTFEKIVFKKKESIKPRSWEEYYKNNEGKRIWYIGETSYIDTACLVGGLEEDKNTLPSKELAKAFLAMMQLMSLRHAWIGDWKPDWKSPEQLKANIIKRSSDFDVVCFRDLVSRPLSFPTKEMAIDFMNCFKDLLEVAKPLI